MTDEMQEQATSFSDLGLDPELVKTLADLGYEEPTPIQAAAIPPLLQGHDLLGQAATGTGKTAAFALPLLQQLPPSGRKRQPVGLVLVPTRELAMQVAEALHKYGRSIGARILPIYGGQPIQRQLRALEQGVDVIVATPGRALDHLRRGTLPLAGVRTIVLDEADEMLDMGFAEDIETILAESSSDRQTVLFSATMPPRIETIARRHLTEPVRLRMGSQEVSGEDAVKIRQTAYIVRRAHKIAALGRILDVESPTAAIVFCRTRTEVDQLTETLSARGYRSEALHGGMSQEQRDRVMNRLRNGTAELLIATDVAARGLDVEHLTHVFNFDVPSAPEAYVHRIGRVGRAGRAGVAITLAEPREHRMLKQIERIMRKKIEIGKIPTVADLQARRMEVTRAAVREVLMDDGSADRYRVVVESLADEFDLMDIAMAAVKLAFEADASNADEEGDIPEAPVYGGARDDRPDPRGETRGRGPRPDRGDRPARPQRQMAGDVARIFIGAGRQAGIRPQDLVGAIANEAGVRGSDIGAIQIHEKNAIVEVSAAVANNVIAALRGTTIKGKKVAVRFDKRD